MDLQIPLLVAWIVNYYGMDLVAGRTGPGNHTCQVNKMDTGYPVKMERRTITNNLFS